MQYLTNQQSGTTRMTTTKSNDSPNQLTKDYKSHSGDVSISTPPTRISGTPSWEEDFSYDPVGNWRATKTIGGTARHYYYSDRWQIVEERVGSATTADRRFVWGTRGIDDLILRGRISSSGGGGGSSSSSGPIITTERFYALTDGINVARPQIW